MAALRARRLVWSEIRLTAPVISPMSCARRSSSVMSSTDAPWRRPLRSMARTEVPICTAVSASTTSTASVRRREASACVRATPRLATTCLMADNCSWEAPAASLAPLAICSIDRRSSSAAAEASVRPLANSSVAAARRSESLSWERAETRLAAPFDGALRAGGRPKAGSMTTTGAVPGFSLDFLMRAMGFSGTPRNSYKQAQSRGHC